MKISSREMTLAAVTGLVALFGISYLMAVPRIKEWTKVMEERRETARKIDLTRRLIGQAPGWETKLQELRRKLPQYPPEKDVSADLYIRIEKLASASGLTLASRDLEKETRAGDMCELAANCKWEGKLEPLVRFLFALQQEDAILDISQLSVAPNEKRLLKGSFTVYCSYSRTKPAAEGQPVTKSNQP